MRVLALGMVTACTYAPTGGGGADGIDAPAPPRDIAVDGAPDSVIDGMAIALVEAEAFTAKTDSPTRAWSMATGLGGYSGAAYMQCGPGTGAACANDANLETCAASLDYAITVAAAADYHVHVRVTATGSSDDTAWYGIDDTAAGDAINFPQDSQWAWRTGATTFSLQAGTHKLTIWQRECGARVDVVAVTDSATPPS